MNKIPKVLMFGWELPPHNSGGLGVACYGLTKGLSYQGIPIKFALPRRLGVHIPFMEILSHDMQGVTLTAIDSLLESYIDPTKYMDILKHTSKEEILSYGDSLFQETLRYGKMASQWSTSQEHDVIHGHDWLTYPAAMNAHKQSGKPWIAHIHATEYDRTGGQINSNIAEVEYQGLNSAQAVIAVSDYTKKIVNKYYGVPLKKIYVVHNGVDFNEFEPKKVRSNFPDKKIVLFVGRLTYQKGVEYFLEAAAKASLINPDLLFLVVGHGDMYKKLILRAAQLGIADKVMFPGFVKGEKLRDCYSMSDIFVMPSTSEPYGIVALEALAAGIPAIISKQSGVVETLDHVFKVDFWNTQRMAEMISSLSSYSQLSTSLAKKAKKEASAMTWDVAAQKTISVYNSILN